MLGDVEPHHYSSHYSNSSTVLHYLVRIPPFTLMFLDFQGGHACQPPSACFFPPSAYSHHTAPMLLVLSHPPVSPILPPSTGQNFDIPDRTFHSLHTSWRLSSSASLSDVKELIPEFFDLPDFLVNAQSACNAMLVLALWSCVGLAQDHCHCHPCLVTVTDPCHCHYLLSLSLNVISIIIPCHCLLSCVRAELWCASDR